MTALPGGAADKLGNQFETWWTLNRLESLLRGNASRMRIEPPGDEGEGIEFWIEENGVRSCEQVKFVPSTRTWTIGALKERKVLSRILGHLENGHRVRLVLSTPAPDLADLVARSLTAENLREFRATLSDKSKPHFAALAAHWNISEESTWSHLQRITVGLHTEHDLVPMVRSKYQQLFSDDPEVVMNELSGWLTTRLHQTLTGPEVWAYMSERGFSRRYLVGDQGTLAALRRTVERHTTRLAPFKPKSALPDQSRVDAVIQWLVSTESTGQQILLLHGAAGSGKSTLTESVLSRLSTMGWFCAVLRMDKTSTSIHTSAALGNSENLSASPAVLLSGVSDGLPAALFIDQLDAVATNSGRMQDNYDSVSDVLAEAAANPNLRLVLVVRSVDLDFDPRLRQLRADTERVGELEIGPYTPAQVAQALGRSGINPRSVDPTTLKLLEVPLHYAIFCQLDHTSPTASYATLPDLYERFTNQTIRSLRSRIGSLNWLSITGPLITYMSRKEVLTAPASILRSADPAEVDALFSAGVLFKENSSVSFFHETYFDYLFAESFVAEDHDLIAFLVESGQALFRRAQIRQVLEYLVRTDRAEFRKTVIRLFSNESVRSHLLEIPITLLGQLEANPDDWKSLSSTALGTSWKSKNLLALLALPSWFDAADATGDWEVMLADETSAKKVANQLISAARTRPERVSQLVRTHLGESVFWDSVCSSLLSWSLRPGLVPLAVEILEGGHSDGLRGPIAVNSDFWSILYTMSKGSPADAATVAGAYLRRALVLSSKDGFANPFESEHLPSYSSSGGEEVILNIASGAPERFIDEVLPFIIRVSEDTADQAASDEFRSGSCWRYRWPGEPHGIDNVLFSGVETALQSLNDHNAADLIELLKPLMTSDFKEIRFLACRALTSYPLADDAIRWLVSDQRNLELGYASGPRWATRDLLIAATASCAPDLLEAISRILLEYYPSYERSTWGRKSFGRAQLELLTGIVPERRSSTVIGRIQELERKFGYTSLEAPQGVTSGSVGAPISQKAVKHMSDAQWMEAIRTHDSDKVEWSHEDGPRGGLRELSSLLGECAIAEPERFARIGLALDDRTYAAHVGSIIRAVAGKISVALLAELCVHGRELAGQALGREICWAIREVASDATEELVELLISCAADDDPAEELARTRAESEEPYYGGDLSVAGLNCTRGAVASAATSIIFAQPERSDRILNLVRKLSVDPILAVRVRAAEAILALLNTHPDQALEIANEMFSDATIDIFDSRETAELLKHACLRAPRIFSSHLARALRTDGPGAKRAGYPWIVAYINGALEDPAPRVISELNSGALAGVAKVLTNSPGVAPEVLAYLLNEDDSEVHDTAARALRHTHELEPAAAENLIQEFISSLAFAKNMENLFVSLDRADFVLPPSTIVACERCVDTQDLALGDIRASDAKMSTHIIAIVLRLYKQGNAELRSRCLDVIDRLTEKGAYGLEGALDQERI